MLDCSPGIYLCDSQGKFVGNRDTHEKNEVALSKLHLPFNR